MIQFTSIMNADDGENTCPSVPTHERGHGVQAKEYTQSLTFKTLPALMNAGYFANFFCILDTVRFPHPAFQNCFLPILELQVESCKHWNCEFRCGARRRCDDMLYN